MQPDHLYFYILKRNKHCTERLYAVCVQTHSREEANGQPLVGMDRYEITWGGIQWYEGYFKRSLEIVSRFLSLVSGP